MTAKMAPHCTTCVEPLKDTSLRYKSAPANIKYAPHIRPVHIAVIALLLVVVSGIGLYLAHTKAEEQRAREAKRTALQATVQALQMAWDEVAHVAQILQMDRRGASQKRPVRSSARPDLWSDRDLRRIDIGDRPQGLRERALALARDVLCWKADFLATSVHLPAGSGKLLSSRLQCADARYRL